MAIGLIGLVLIQVGLTILGRLLAGRTKRQKPAPFEVPKAESGAVVTKSFGIQQVTGNVFLVRDKTTALADDGTRAYYYARIAMGLGIGPVDKIWDIIVDERSLLLEKPSKKQQGEDRDILGGFTPNPIVQPIMPITLEGDNPTNLIIGARQLFGGNKEEGGIQGEARFYRGTNDQPIDPLVRYAYGEFASAYPHLCYICFGNDPEQPSEMPQWNLEGLFYMVANVPTPKPISVIIGYYPRALLGGTAQDAAISRGANPAEMIYEVLTDPRYGRGWSSARFNVPQWEAKARQFKAEGLGLSMTLSGQTIDDFIDDIESHADCKVITHPLTGLLELQVLRADYNPDDLFVLDSTNAREFHRGGKTIARTLNYIQVKFKSFVTGGINHLEEIITQHVDFFQGIFYWQADGRNLSNVVVTRIRGGDVLELAVNVDYLLAAGEGGFLFTTTSGNVLSGDRLEVTYDFMSTFSGFVDDVVSEQNPANVLLTGSVRSESYDYPFFTNKTIAKMKAIRLRKLLTQDRENYRWKMNKAGSDKKIGDVIKVVEPKWGINSLVLRITKMDRGGFNSRLMSCEGIEDIWGDEISFANFSFNPDPPPPPPLPPLEATVGLTCLGGAIRIGLTVSDPTYNVEILSADDAEGSNAILLTPEDIGISGENTYFDDPQAVGVTRWYRARLIMPSFFAAGPMSPVISCTASATPPTDPSVILPTWSITQQQDDVTGQAELFITDPQSRVTLVEVQTQVDSQAATAYVPLTAPYQAVVGLVSTSASFIRYRITYFTDTTDVTDVAEAVFEPFGIPPEIPPPGGSSGAGLNLIYVPFHATLTHGAVVRDSPSDWIPIGSHGMRRIDVSNCDQCQLQLHVKTPLPDGGRLAVQYVSSFNKHPVEEDWKFLTDIGGPIVAADAATDIPDVSVWSPLSLEARQEIVTRLVMSGGDGVVDFSTHQSFIVFKGTTGSTGEPEDPPPDPCEETTIHFGGYDSAVDMQDQGWVFTEESPGGVVLDPIGGPNGEPAMRLDFSETLFSSSNIAELTLSGLIPGTTYFVGADIKFSGTFNEDTFSGLSAAFGGADNPKVFFFVPAGASGLEYIGAYKTLAPGQGDVANGSGEVVIHAAVHTSGDVIDPFSGTHRMWVANIRVTSADGTLISPCISGPTIPEFPGGGGPPPPIPPLGPQKLYLTGFMEPLWPSLTPFTGTLLISNASNLMSVLDACEAAGLKLFLNTVSRNEAMSGGIFSQAAYISKLNTFASIGPTAAAHPAMGGIRVLDEPNSVIHWNTVVPVSVVDGVLAKRTAEIFPNVPLHLRMRASLIEASGYHPEHIQIATCHYVKREGTVASYMAAERAAATRLGLSIGWGMNPLGGGASPMSPAEVQSNGLAMANDPNPFYHISVWMGTPTPYPEYTTSAYLNAFSVIATALNT